MQIRGSMESELMRHWLLRRPVSAYGGKVIRKQVMSCRNKCSCGVQLGDRVGSIMVLRVRNGHY